MLASARGHAATVRGIMSHGALVDVARYDGTTSLMLAAQANHVDVVRATRALIFTISIILYPLST